MGLFTSSKSSSSTSNKQLGVEASTGSNVTTLENGATLTNNFPDSVAEFATAALNLSEKSVAAARSLADKSTVAVSAAATQTKAPAATYLPFAVVAGAVFSAYFIWGKK